MYNHHRNIEQSYHEQHDSNVDDSYGDYNQPRSDYDPRGHDTHGYAHDHARSDARGYQDNYHQYESIARHTDEHYTDYTESSHDSIETGGQYRDHHYREERHYEEQYHVEHYSGDHQYADDSYYDEEPHRNNLTGVYEQDFDIDGFDDHTDTFASQTFEDREFENSGYAGAGHTSNELTDPQFNDYAHGQPGALYAEDFKDVGHQSRNRFTASLGKLAAGTAIVLFTLGVGVLTLFASKPQLTPADIVQMEGYQGTEHNRTMYFNLASMRNCDSIQDCEGVVVAGQSNASGTQTKTTYGRNTGTSDAANTGNSTMKNYLEIPAVATPSEQQRQSSANAEQWSVRKQWSIVRESPERNSPIVASLEADSRVTVIGQVGEWKEISTSRNNSKSVVTGYMHSSLLKPVSQ